LEYSDNWDRILRVKHAARIALLVVLLAALPLRGYAGVLMALCEGHHGGAAAVQEPAHEHGESHHHASSDDGSGIPTHAASVCSVCASCCAGAGLAAPSVQGVVIQPPGTSRISSLDRQVSVFVPEHPDRPPLAL
jgi:hypothetical protein